MSTDMKEVWDLLLEDAEEDTPQPGEKTVSQFKTELNKNQEIPWSVNQVKYFLDKKVEEGKLTRRRIKKVLYYRPVI